MLTWQHLHSTEFKSGINKYYFSSIDHDMGLSYNHIKVITQDQLGFMWFGSRNGINRYDGIEVRQYSIPSFSTESSNINALCNDGDNHLWIGTRDGVFIYNYASDSIEAFDLGFSVQKNNITDIKIDKQENIWIANANFGVLVYDKKLKKIKTFKDDKFIPQKILIDSNGRVWISSYFQGIMLYNEVNETLENHWHQSFEGKTIASIADYNNYIVIALQSGEIKKFHKTTYQIYDICKVSDAKENIFLRELSNINEELWVCSESGIYIINEENKTITNIRAKNFDPFSLSENSVYYVYKDRENGIWLGTYFSGINYTRGVNDMFDKHIPIDGSTLTIGKRIREVCEVKNNNFWIATEDNGLFHFNPLTKQYFQESYVNGNVSRKNAHAICLVEDNVLVGYFNNGLDVFDRNGKLQKHINLRDIGLIENTPNSVFYDSKKNIWIGTLYGAALWDMGKNIVKKIEELEGVFVFDIEEDRVGNIWIATMGEGVYMYTPDSNKYTHFVHNPNDNLSLPSNLVNGILEDSKGKIWFSTDGGGICVYNHNAQNFTSYGVEHGLPDNVTYQILEDSKSNLWFGSNSGLAMFNPENQHVRVFTQNEGLISNQFNYKSALKSENGIFYFGNMDGLISFDPNDVKTNTVVPNIVVTDFLLTNDGSNLKLKENINYTKSIYLTHTQSSFSIKLAVLSFIAPKANRFSYKLDNYNSNWITTGGNTVSFSNLSPGKYIFHAKGINNSGIASNNQILLEIIIYPPWWRSNIAYAIYFIITAVLILLILKYYTQRIEKENKHKQDVFKIQKERELYDERIQFLQNITHEIKTPLSLISGPLENIISLQMNDSELVTNLNIMQSNTDRLVNLVNQLMDFSRVEIDKLVLKQTMVDVSILIKDTIERFTPYAEQNMRTITSNIEPNILVYIDKEAFIKIVSNMLNNAVKYSSKNILISLSAAEDYFLFEILNDGELIPAKFEKKIFNPFFQINANKSGSGIGLSLCKSLVELHGGTISFSTANKLNAFSIRIPCGLDKVILKEDSDLVQNNVMADKPTILIVEDDKDMQGFIYNIFQKEYSTISASTAEASISIIKNTSIALIISDVMLGDGMNGFAFCNLLKSDIEYSHIPIILLTARTDNESKIHGLELGADAYIEKPFSVKYLQAQVTSLLENRLKLLDYFSKNPLSYIQSMGMSKVDEEFMENVISIIHDNLIDEDFNIDKLSESLFMSRSTLYRKIKDITQMSTNEFIRLIRLKKAAEYLYEGKYRVNEVAYLVGLKSTAYFTKIFQNQFGVLPKDFIK